MSSGFTLTAWTAAFPTGLDRSTNPVLSGRSTSDSSPSSVPADGPLRVGFSQSVAPGGEPDELQSVEYVGVPYSILAVPVSGAAHASNRKRFGDVGPNGLFSLGQERPPETPETSDGGWGHLHIGPFRAIISITYR